MLSRRGLPGGLGLMYSFSGAETKASECVKYQETSSTINTNVN